LYLPVLKISHHSLIRPMTRSTATLPFLRYRKRQEVY